VTDSYAGIPGARLLSRRATTLGFTAAFVSSAGQTFFIGLFGAPLREELGLTEAQFGGLYGVATLASGLLMFWLGQLADRWSMQWLVRLALAVLGIGAIQVSLVTGPFGLLIALFCLRLGGQGLASHLAIVAAARHGLQRGRSISIAVLGFVAGEAILPIAVAGLLGVIDWRWIWGGVAVLVLLLALPTLQRLASSLPRAAGVPANTAAQLSPRIGRRKLLASRAFLGALSILLVSPFVITAIFLHQGTLALERGWTAEMVAIGFLAFAIVQGGATWAAGRWIDRVGALSILRVYLLPLAVGTLMLAYAPPLAALWGTFIGLGLTAGANSVVASALWVELFGIDNLGLVRGVYAAFAVLTTALSPVLLGLAFQATVPLTSIAIGVALYAIVVPILMRRAGAL
jgi:MFS family permease